MINILEIFEKQNKVQEFLNLQNDKYSTFVYNSTTNVNYLLTALLYKQNKENVFYITSNLYQATKAYENFCKIVGFENVSFYAVDDLVTAEVLAVSSEFRIERMNTVKSLLNDAPKIIVTHTYAAIKPISSKQIISQNIINLQVNDIIDVEELLRRLVLLGYKRAPVTSVIGEFSVRGGIIDIYPIGYDKPVRLDLFDIDIEDIRVFNPETQISEGKIDNVIIYPLYDFIYDSNDFTQAIKNNINGELSEEIAKEINSLIEYRNIEKASKYAKYINMDYGIILDYDHNSLVCIEDFNKVYDNFTELNINLNNYLSDIKYPKHMDLVFYTDIYEITHRDRVIYYSEFLKTLDNIKLSNIIDMGSIPITNYENNIKNFIYDLKTNHNRHFIISYESKYQGDLLRNLFKDNNIDYTEVTSVESMSLGNINLIKSNNSISFGFIDGLVEFYTHNDIFKDLKFKKTKYRSAYQNTVALTSKDDLSLGDYVVHYDYGIGIYQGIKTIELNNIKNDFLWIKYEDMELYVPLEDLNLIEKYYGSEASVPKLTKLSTKEWTKRKRKIQDRIENMAEELIKVQALRETTKGFSFPADDEISEMFADDFEFEETKDQLQAIKEVTLDMESSKVMDRLVCGDVGFGKTEVALRASMKCVRGNKQVLYLTPTTILCRQHYNTFIERFEKYGIRVEQLSRLVEPKKQKEIIRDLKLGLVDIIIGTHRALSDDVEFKDLGLLIIDEEQRFGVQQKEKIKEKKHNIDVLTLSATPIPRTLQMSIVGIRSISLLETPPENRYPIQTFVLEENDVIIREAIYRELSRGGQVFYLHNRISELDRIYRKLSRLVPEAKIVIAHGRMDKDFLEDIIQNFIDGYINVLISTTIIETGIDIPNANTLIISNVDRLGLSQIYQIRGRVGRSNRIAYAYLMYDKGKVLTEQGAKRLNAIKEFTELGSGYKIAMRDLSIRGAGDILGKEQSGFIDALGLDAYMRLLDESIAKLTNTDVSTKAEKRHYQIETSKHVSTEYVSDEEIRILIHQEIAKVKTKEDKQKVIDSLNDRFGRLSDELLLYIERKYLENLMNKYNVEEYRECDQRAKFTFSEEQSSLFDGEQLFRLANNISTDFYFEYKNKKIIAFFDKKGYNKKWIYIATEFFEDLDLVLKLQ